MFTANVHPHFEQFPTNMVAHGVKHDVCQVTELFLIMFICCLCLAPCKTCPTMQVVMCLSHDPSNHFSLSLKAGTVNAHNTWFLYLYFYFCFCICSFVFSEKPEEEREAVATWQRLWWSITLASLHRSNHWIYSFVRTVVGGDGDVDHGEDVGGRDDQWVQSSYTWVPQS